MKTPERPNCYEVLNVAPQASREAIQQAYLLAAATYGPDSLAAYSLLSERERHEIGKQVEAAFQILSDPQRRKEYDASLGIVPAASDQPASAAERPRLQESPDYRLSSGSYLKYVRQLRGLSLRDIADTTRISIAYLEALENEAYDRLPEGVYRTFILGAYARSLRLDAQLVVRDFQQTTR